MTSTPLKSRALSPGTFCKVYNGARHLETDLYVVERTAGWLDCLEEMVQRGLDVWNLATLEREMHRLSLCPGLETARTGSGS